MCMEKINYVESPSFGVKRALFFDKGKVRIHGHWYPYSNKQTKEVYHGVQRMTMLVQTDEFKSERMYFYQTTKAGWIYDNSIKFNKRVKF